MAIVYALVNLETKEVVDRLQPLPEYWENISQLGALEYEQVKNLEWAGHPNKGWISVNDPFFAECTCSEDNLNMNKLNLKVEIQNQMDMKRECLLKYKEYDIPFNQDVRVEFSILRTYAKDLRNSYFPIKLRFQYYNFTGHEVLEIGDLLEKHNQDCNKLESSIYSQVDACANLADLTKINYDI